MTLYDTVQTLPPKKKKTIEYPIVRNSIFFKVHSHHLTDHELYQKNIFYFDKCHHRSFMKLFEDIYGDFLCI